MVSFSQNETCCATTEETTSAGQCKANPIQIGFQSWCLCGTCLCLARPPCCLRDGARPELSANHFHDIRDRAQRAVDRVLVTPQILLTEGAEGFTHQIDLLGTSKRHYAGFTAVAGGQRPNTSACWRLPLSPPVKGRAAFKVDARRRRTSSRRRRRGPRVAGTEDRWKRASSGGPAGRCR